MTWIGFHLVLLAAVIVSVSQSDVIREAGRCVTYGYQGDADDGLVNAVNNTRAVPVLDHLYPDIGTRCPSLSTASELCCDLQQYMQLSERLQQARPILNRCQACYQNFRDFFCQYTCSPDQSLFKEVTKTVTNDAGLEVVRDVNFYVESNYAQQFFDSCRSIKFGATGEKLFDMIFQSASTPYEWFRVLGSDADHGGYSSEYIQFPQLNQTSPDGISPLSSTEKQPLIVPCSTTIPELACSCSDCPSACPSSDIIDLEAGSAPNSGRDLFLGILCIPTILFILGIIFLSTSDRRFFVRHDRRYRTLHCWSSKPLLEHFGRLVGEYPSITIMTCIVVVSVLAYVAAPRIVLLQDPVKLWTPIHSESFQSMLRNQEAFGPAFRVEQIIISSRNGAPLFQENTSLSFVDKLRSVRDLVKSIRTDNNATGFEDLCYRLAPGKPCLIQSILGWFDAEEGQDGNAYKRLMTCANNNYQEDCFDRDGLPTLSNVALGGYTEADYASSTTAVFTVLLSGANDESHRLQCEQWERNFITLVQTSILDMLSEYRVSFSSQQSLQTELNSQTNQDAFSVMLSYLLMFVYISFALGDVFPLRSLLRSTRLMLAFVAISVVAMSVIAACAICAFAGVEITLIISEVIPFIILAIGVDSTFLLSDSFRKQNCALSEKERLAKTLSDVGPSLFLTALCESGAFLLGLLTTMPAVRGFACYAAVSVAINLFLQLTCFSAAMVLDAKWFGRDHGFTMHRRPQESAEVNRNWDPIQTFMKRFLSPLISQVSRARIVCSLFCVVVILSLITLYSKLQLGLDPSIALPAKSYLQPYLHDVASSLRVGPPIYMTVQADFSDRNIQNALCTLPQCNRDSLGEIMNLAAQLSDSTFIASGVSNWIDDYLQWLNAPFLHNQDSICCRRHKVTQQFCSVDDLDENCAACIDDKGISVTGAIAVDSDGRPTADAFSEFLPGFLSANCSESCIFCATPHYRNLQMESSDDNTVKIGAARFMAYHKVLTSQRDFISALKSARSLSQKVSSKTSIPTYADSSFYVFFEQYLNIEYIAALALSLAIAFVSLMLLILFRDLRIALATSATIFMILVDLIGIMAIADLSLNAISVVNLITCVGLSVEFCVPVIYRYLRKESKSPEGMTESLSRTGSCVVRGIFLTKICGLAVLFASATPMIRTYYAFMYALICILGFLHGFIFLPALVVLIDSPQSGIEHERPLISESRQERWAKDLS